MTFNIQFLILSFNISLRNSPQHSAITEAFPKGNLYFLQCVGKLLSTKNFLNSIYVNF